MSRGPSTFRKRDLVMALEAALAAGLPVAGYTIQKDGTIKVITSKNDAPAEFAEVDDEWKGATV